MVGRRFALTLLALALASGAGMGQVPHQVPNEARGHTHSIMHFTPEWMKEHHRRRMSLPVTQATPEEYLAIM